MANGKVSYRDRAAAKKNAQKAEQRRKDQARKAFLEKNGRKITIASVAGVAALIVLFLLLLFYFLLSFSFFLVSTKKVK